ncbi:MAG: hypothetical protein QXX17_07045 [Conexivisphaerales archaeon]
MVLAGKLFRIPEAMTLEQVYQKLKDFRVESEDSSTGLMLVVEVRDLQGSEKEVKGVMTKDEVITLKQRDELKPYVRTLSAPFFFRKAGDAVYLLILEKKRRANEFANDLSRIIFMRPGHILEARIKPETMQKYYESSFEDARIIFFDQVDIPNIEKMALYGQALSDTDLYHDYLKHGNLWYIVVQSKSKGFVVGLTRNCVVTVFSQSTPDELVSYAFEEVVPLTLE